MKSDILHGNLSGTYEISPLKINWLTLVVVSCSMKFGNVLLWIYKNQNLSSTLVGDPQVWGIEFGGFDNHKTKPHSKSTKIDRTNLLNVQ